MGANRTQAQGVALFLIAFVCMAAGLAEDVNYLWIALGIMLIGASAALLIRCKPWEHQEGREGEAR